MGSLFYINVPTRENEIILRQKALQIKVEKEIPNVNKSLLANLLKIKRASNTAAPGHNNSRLPNAVRAGTDVSQSPSASSVDPKVDVYEAVVNGKKTNIVVSQDAMIILPNAIPLRDDTLQNFVVPPDALSLNSVTENMFLERNLEDALKTLRIYDAIWGQSVDGNFSQVSFTVQDNRTESIINFMLNLGIGMKYDSTLGVCSAIIYYNPNKQESGTGEVGAGEKKESFGSQFIASIKSRLTVAQVVQTVQANAMISFDYILLVIIAAIISALGLVENSSVNLVASMLISPLMGPIMACCFGTVVRDKKLIKTGVISELIGLSMCLVIGFLFGILVGASPFEGPWAKLKYWPTDEMLSRGRIRSFAVGAFIAIPSGAGVALSILAGNAGSLVGVALAASLLPPAVDCGIFFGMSAVITIQLKLAGLSPYTTPCGEYVSTNNTNSTDHLYRLTREGYMPTDFFCKNIVKEYGLLGIVSLGLTIVNIILILVSAFLILKLKEVAPHTTRKTMNRFWKEDLKVMRDYNKTHGSFNKQAILAEIGSSHNAAAIRADLANDAVFNQVARRNAFGNAIGAKELLDSQIFTSMDAIPTITSTTPAVKSGDGVGGWFNSWFGSRKPPSHLPTPKASKTTQHAHLSKQI